MLLLKNNSAYDDTTCLKIWEYASKAILGCLKTNRCSVCQCNHLELIAGELIKFNDYKAGTLQVEFKAKCLYDHTNFGEFYVSKELIEDLV